MTNTSAETIFTAGAETSKEKSGGQRSDLCPYVVHMVNLLGIIRASVPDALPVLLHITADRLRLRHGQAQALRHAAGGPVPHLDGHRHHVAAADKALAAVQLLNVMVRHTVFAQQMEKGLGDGVVDLALSPDAAARADDVDVAPGAFAARVEGEREVR